MLLDVGATDGHDVAHVLTDGLAGGESRAQPVMALLAKSRREKSFPTELLKEGLTVNIELASATQAADKTSILNSIAFPRSRTIALNSNYSRNHPSYQIVNRALASHFALAAMYTSYLQGQDVSNLLVALQADEARTSLQLSLHDGMRQVHRRTAVDPSGTSSTMSAEFAFRPGIHRFEMPSSVSGLEHCFAEISAAIHGLFAEHCGFQYNASTSSAILETFGALVFQLALSGGS